MARIADSLPKPLAIVHFHRDFRMVTSTGQGFHIEPQRKTVDSFRLMREHDSAPFA
jgi:hypothetical protein